MHAPAALRDAALRVVETLHGAGHEAYLVGGCVRDELLGREPHEFDVATSAHPAEVEALFAETRAIGAQFGVILVLLEGLPTEVATFRSDEAYVDGRRPTGVTFTTAREDAERRDFTVNALFKDPRTGEIHDFVGGRADLEAGVIRAIGNAEQRFAEDRLRLLRAVRFSSTLDFSVEEATWDAICRMAPHIVEVSWERIRVELERILLSGRSTKGFLMLDQSGLLAPLLPELTALKGVEQPPNFHPEGDVWVHTLLLLEHFDELEQRELTVGLAALLHDIGKPSTFERAPDRIRFDGHDRVGRGMSEEVLRRLRFPNAVIEEVCELVGRHMAFLQIQEWREAKLRRFLTSPLAERHLRLHRLDCLASHGGLDAWNWSHLRRGQFLAETPPPPRCLSGTDLIAAGYAPGPLIGKALAAMDDERLEGRLATKEEALAWVLEHFPPDGGADEDA